MQFFCYPQYKISVQNFFLLYNFCMSKRNVIILLSLLIVVAFIVLFYLYKENKNIPLPPPLTTTDTQKAKDEIIKKDLLQFQKSPEVKKTDTQIKKELESYKAPPRDQALSDEEMLKALTDPSIKINP